MPPALTGAPPSLDSGAGWLEVGVGRPGGLVAAGGEGCQHRQASGLGPAGWGLPRAVCAGARRCAQAGVADGVFVPSAAG